MFKMPQTQLLDWSGSNYCIVLQGAWEAAVKQIKLKVLCVIASQCRPLLFSNVKDHSKSKHRSRNKPDKATVIT